MKPTKPAIFTLLKFALRENETNQTGDIYFVEICSERKWNQPNRRYLLCWDRLRENETNQTGDIYFVEIGSERKWNQPNRRYLLCWDRLRENETNQTGDIHFVEIGWEKMKPTKPAIFTLFRSALRSRISLSFWSHSVRKDSALSAASRARFTISHFSLSESSFSWASWMR